MTLPGGPAAKLGSRYEAWWTVRQLLRVLAGEATRIRIETPGVDTAEFVLTIGDVQEFHQAKRRHRKGAWTLSRLDAEDLLQAAFQHLERSSARFVFVSRSDAPELAALAESARASASPEEFEREFLKSAESTAGFNGLLKFWRCGAETARDRLQRIQVRTVDETTLREEITSRVRLFFADDDVPHVMDALRTIVDDSIHDTIDEETLLDRLAQRRLSLRPSASPKTARQLVRAATDRYLQSTRRQLILGRVLARRETPELVHQLRQSEQPEHWAITGKAGVGKTACAVDIVEQLRASDVPVLAFRMDRLSRMSTMKELATYLGLDTDSPALALHTAARAANRPAVLVIDQLDALSSSSGRTADAFDLIDHLLQDTRNLPDAPPIHTVIICRDFDLANDPTLRSLVASSVRKLTVDEFDAEEVDMILVEAGLDPSDLEQRQRNLLTMPLNLALFLEISQHGSPPSRFRTAKGLFDKYWDVKRRAITCRPAVRHDQWMQAMEFLVDGMTATQRLAVVHEHLDEIEPAYLDALVSEGVLIRDRATLSFAHESLLDYVFARLFILRRTTLATFLKNSGQGLFRRAQVRQTLSYLRDADRERYVEQLRELLGDPNIRAHVKDLVLSLLADVPDPREGEWIAWEERIEPILTSYQRDKTPSDKLARLAWRRLLTSKRWLAYADEQGLVDRWLSWKHPGLVDDLTAAMSRDQERFAERLGARLAETPDESGERRINMDGQIASAGEKMGRKMFEGLLRRVDSVPLAALGGAGGIAHTLQTFWYIVGHRRPEWMAELVAALARCAMRAVRDTDGNESSWRLLGGGLGEGDVVVEAARAAPKTFAELVLPPILELSELAAFDKGPPHRDRIWPAIPWGATESLSVTDAIVTGLADALSTWASEGSIPEAIVDDLRRRDTGISNHMLLAIYRGDPQQYSEAAVKTFLGEPWRFECGTMDSDYWFSRKTVASLCTHLAPENLKLLEAGILGFVPAWERSPDGYRFRGGAQFDLLSSIPSELRSQKVNARISELRRKFLEPSEPPSGIRSGMVGSPIPSEATERMTDDQWLRAIKKYAGSWSTGLGKDGEFKGGARQLSSELEHQTEEDPIRFGRLATRLAEDAHPAYLSAILRGLETTEHAVPDELRVAVCGKAYEDALENLDVARGIAKVLGGLVGPVTDGPVEMLSWLATQHPHLDSPFVRDEAAELSADPIHGIYTWGINTARGKAAKAVAQLVWRDPDNINKFEPAIDVMLREQHPGVVSCVGAVIAAVNYHDPERGIRLLLRVRHSDGLVFATPHFLRLLAAQLPERFGVVRPLVETMVRSGAAHAQRAGAQLTALAVLYENHAADLVAEAMQGSAAHRQGIARVASRYLADSNHRAWCERHLIILFDDADERVRQQAASCFREFHNRGLDACGDLIEAFVASRAFGHGGAEEILAALDRSPSRLPGVTCTVCERFLDRFGDRASDMTTRSGADAMDVAKLVFRTYQQHQGDEWGERALDLIDRLCLDQPYGLHDEFKAFER